MQVGEQAEVLVRLVQPLAAQRAVAIALEVLRQAGRDGVVHPVVAGLVQNRQPQRRLLAGRHVERALGVDGAERAHRQAAVALEVPGRSHRIELHHAGRRVAAEQGALRAAQHLDAGDVERREALEDRVFLHDVVIHQRHRLRRVQAEVGVAIAADVEAREGAAERRLDVQVRHAPGQAAQVLPAGVDDVEQLATDRADGARHVLDVLAPRSAVTVTVGSLPASGAAVASGVVVCCADAPSCAPSSAAAAATRCSDTGQRHNAVRRATLMGSSPWCVCSGSVRCKAMPRAGTSVPMICARSLLPPAATHAKPAPATALP